MYVRLTYYMSRDSIIPQRVERLNAQSGCDGVHRVLLLNDQNRKVTATRRRVKVLYRTQCIMVSFAVRSFDDITVTKNERTSWACIFHKTFNPHHLGPWLHKELSSLVYIFIYLNFPHLTTFYFPLTCPPNNRRFVGPFQIAPVSLIRLDHPTASTMLYLYFPFLCAGRLIYLYSVCEKVESTSGRSRRSSLSNPTCRYEHISSPPQSTGRRTNAYLVTYSVYVCICGSWFPIMISYWVTDR